MWLFVLAIALHHFPEGLAIGLGTESTHDAGIAIGVALQNLPEGLMVALALRQLGYGVGPALGFATLSGWLEPLGGWLGVTLVDLGSAIAPMGMAMAAGAMLFVVLHELLPELNLKTLNSSGSLGLMTGLVVMGMVEQFLG
ncbi:MAG: ZIP family metal transporter [Cyanophyceae cyanobacterium]